MLEDISVLTGGRVISEEAGLKLEAVTLEDLGQAKRITLDKDNATIIRVRAKALTSRAASRRSAVKSKRPPPTTTARSSRSASPSCLAVSLSFASVRPPRWR